MFETSIHQEQFSLKKIIITAWQQPQNQITYIVYGMLANFMDVILYLLYTVFFLNVDYLKQRDKTADDIKSESSQSETISLVSQ